MSLFFFLFQFLGSVFLAWDEESNPFCNFSLRAFYNSVGVIGDE